MEDVAPTQTVQFPLKIMVCGMISYCALSDLRIIPRGQTVTSKYYVEKILEKAVLPAFNRTHKNGSVLTCKMLADMSQAIFQQDGAPAHHSAMAQQWLQTNIQTFWLKGTWPGNSPYLSPIENLWVIVQQKLKEMEPATNEENLIEKVTLPGQRFLLMCWYLACLAESKSVCS